MKIVRFGIAALIVLACCFASAEAASSIADAKKLNNGTTVTVTGTVTAVFGSVFYISANDRSCGIRVSKTGHGTTVGQGVQVAGTMTTTFDGAERQINATSITSAAPAEILPVAMNNRALGGDNFGIPPFGQVGVVPDGVGLNNIGMLVRSWGRLNRTSASRFSIDDGSGLNVEVDAPSGAIWSANSIAAVTGISSCTLQNGELRRFIRGLHVDTMKEAPQGFAQFGIYHTGYPFQDVSYLGITSPSSGVSPGLTSFPQIYSFDKSFAEPYSTYEAKTDAFMRALHPSVKRVSLGEENIWWNNAPEVLNGLYDYIKANFPGVEVYQWFSPGGGQNSPILSIKADGWVMDEYGADGPRFRKYLMKHLVTGKKVVNCIWASPGDGTNSNIDNFATDVYRSQGQVDVCREFNIQSMYFCVSWSPNWGSVADWVSRSDPAVKKWRDWLVGSHFVPGLYPYFFPELDPDAVVNISHTTPASELPAASANYSIGNGVDTNVYGQYNFLEEFDSISFMDTATIDGFLNLRWDYVDGRLITEPKPDGGSNITNQSSVVYEFRPSSPARNISSRVTGTIKGNGTMVELSLSLDGVNWEAHADFYGAAGVTQPFDFSKSIPGVSDSRFFVRVRSVVPERGDAFVSLDNLRASALLGEPGASVDNVTIYQNDFGTALQQTDMLQSGWSGAITWQEGAPDLDGDGLACKAKVATNWTSSGGKRLYKKIDAPAGMTLKYPKFTAYASGNKVSLGTWVNIFLSRDGVTWEHPSNWSDGSQTLLIADSAGDSAYAALKSVWISGVLYSTSGLPIGDGGYPRLWGITLTSDLVVDPNQ